MNIKIILTVNVNMMCINISIAIRRYQKNLNKLSVNLFLSEAIIILFLILKLLIALKINLVSNIL